MAFVKQTSSSIDSVRPYLEGVAKYLVDRIWGPKGPAWGTPLAQMEELVVSLREIISEKMLALGLQRQADDDSERPAEFRNCPTCSGPTKARDPEPRLVTTLAGEAEWSEPHAFCTRCRRTFFPSVPKSGD
jgi:hypothetical protein